MLRCGLVWMGEPLHHLRWSPSPRGEAFGGGEGFGVEVDGEKCLI